MTRDASDWDPLPTEQTGLHPGEAQKFLGGPEPQAQSQVQAAAQQFVVVRSAAPGAAFGGASHASKPRAATATPRALPKPSAGAPRPQEPRLDMLSAMQRPQPAPLPPALLGPQWTQAIGAPARASATPRVDKEAEIVRDSKPEPQPEPRLEAKAETKLDAKPNAKEPTHQGTTSFSSAAAPAYAGMDPRQQQPWFLAMPVVEQMRLLRAWQQERDAACGMHTQGTARRDRLLERFWVAYVVFFVAALPLMLTEGLMGFVRMAMAGCVTGLLWQVVPHTRVACAWSAVGAYVAVAILPRIGELVEAPFSLLTSLGGAALVYWLAGLGAAHEPHVEHTEPNAGD